MHYYYLLSGRLASAVQSSGVMQDKYEIEVAQMVASIIGLLQKGEFNEAARGHETTPVAIASASITEMCRQAFTGEWEHATDIPV